MYRLHLSTKTYYLLIDFRSSILKTIFISLFPVVYDTFGSVNPDLVSNDLSLVAPPTDHVEKQVDQVVNIYNLISFTNMNQRTLLHPRISYPSS